MASSWGASTSSASSLRPSSYDVFISFRGADTRGNFVSLLYDALRRDGIHAFIDSEELWEGEEIRPSLLRGIRGSKISIPVFSKHYADSKYCLLELSQIWESHLSDGQTILPIFIGVEPRDVGHQTGSFRGPFEEHQTNSEPDIVESWKNALRKVGKIKGWTLKVDATIKEQSSIVDLVVHKALRELDSTPLDERKHLVGIDCHVAKLLGLLQIGSDDVQFVGICGMGGLGKTTIAEVVYNHIFRSFKGSSFLADVREAASEGNKGLISLQKQLLEDIFKRDDYNISTISKGSKLIKERLHREKILLILDDVDNDEQLQALAGELNWFGQGSKVIITTRDVHILNVHGKKVGKDIQIYMPEELNPENSLHLFSLHAFSVKEPPQNYKQLSLEVVRYAGGLPLTLEVLGSFLIDKNKEEWEDTLESLEDTKSIKNYDEKVFAKLIISYNKLGDSEKTIFLDIACNFNGYWRKERLISIWEACELHPRLAIKELTQKHLLKIDDEYGTLRMHDQLQYMGRRIVLQDSFGDTTKRSRLWSQDDILKVLKRDMGTHKMVEGILIDKNYKFEDKDVLRYEDFEKMPNLRFLWVWENKLNGDFLRLPPALKWFNWGGYNFEIVPANFYHEELVYLELATRRLKLAWNGTPQNNEKKFLKLKVLILYDCCELSVSPNFLSWFPCLQRLEIVHSSSPIELPDCISQMCPSLKTLIVADCSSFKKLPTTIGDVKHLVKLSVKETKIEQIPDGVGQLEKLEELNVSYCHNKTGKLVKLPTSVRRMTSLRHVDLAGTRVVILTDDFSKLSSLEVFHMPRSLPEVNQSTRYMRLQPVPISMSVFSQLQELSLSDYTTSLESFPELPSSLTSLRVELCHLLKTIPDLSHLERLKNLTIKKCDGLRNLVKLPSSLIHLTLYSCKSLVVFPDLSKLERLRELDIGYCKNLEEIHGIEGTKSLEELSVQNCNKITETTRKILERGILKGNSGKGQGSKSVVDDEIHNGSPILCVVFALTFEEEWKDCMVIIEACIRRGEKRTSCIHTIKIGDIEFRTYQDIIYIHHFKGFDWFGFPLESRDAIEELSAKITYFNGYDACRIEAKFLKVLFENKESDWQMPDQQSSAMLVADFFELDADGYDYDYENDDASDDDDDGDEDDYKDVQDDDECDEEEMLNDDDEASDFNYLDLFSRFERLKGFNLQQMPDQQSSAISVADFLESNADDNDYENDEDHKDDGECDEEEMLSLTLRLERLRQYPNIYNDEVEASDFFS